MKIKNHEQLKKALEEYKRLFRKTVAEHARDFPSKPLAEIGELYGVDASEVSRYCKEFGIVRPSGGASPAYKAKK